MFCWFLKEKKSASGISLVPDEILCNFAVKSNPNYYHNILEPLFFELLNTEWSKRVGNAFIRSENKLSSQIPYLNGGLFTPHLDDNYKKVGIITIPNVWFEILFSLLERYNFTVDENSSYDIELSIDPEMLGRIFENLLAEINPETGESARKSTGSFYTPREVVDYMVDSSLLAYLKEKTGILEEKIQNTISWE